MRRFSAAWLRAARLLGAAGLAAWAVLFLCIYLPDVGHGFISDDFAWIRHGRLDTVGAVGRILTTAQGFYRPVVSLTFGLDQWLAPGLPFVFAATNLAMALLAAWLLRSLGRRLGLGESAAVAAAALWLFNFHGINMSVLWLSGRTALCLTVFALLAARAHVGGRPFLTGLAALAAMGSKEEAVVLPLLFLAWDLWDPKVEGEQKSAPAYARRLRQAVIALGPTWVALGVYLLLRTHAGALFVTSAPSYYQPTFDLARVAVNALHYLDRSATFTAGALVITMALARRLPALTPRHVCVVGLGLIWAVAGVALTVFLPVRSSLYAVFPSVGVALAGASLIEAVAIAAPARRRPSMLLVPLAIVVCLVPVYRIRNVRWVELADLSSDVIGQLRAEERAGLLDSDIVVILDDTRTRASLQNAWGSLAPDVARVMFGRRFCLQVAGRHALTDVTAGAADQTVLRLEDGELLRQ